MPDTAEVVGDEFVVVHNQQTVRLSLAVSLEALDAWMGIDDDMAWRQFHTEMRDRVMPAQARERILAVETEDATFAVALVRGWANALNDRLGKSLSLSPFGEPSGPPLPPISGSGTESTPTEPEPTAPPKPLRRTRSRS